MTRKHHEFIAAYAKRHRIRSASRALELVIEHLEKEEQDKNKRKARLEDER